MSEVELHTMRNRLDRGRMNKAHRGEMFLGVPMGYVILPNGEAAFDPDEQARSVVQLVFAKFDEIGTTYGLMHDLVRNHIMLPVRPRSGPKKGEIDWRRPSLATLGQLLHHPIYAGAYTFGRRSCDPKAKYSASKDRGKKSVRECKVLIHDRLPAYITWERYLKNQERLRQNRRGQTTPGTPGRGAALLGGLLVCGTCDRRMTVVYPTRYEPQYTCKYHQQYAHKQICYGLSSNEIDQLVSEQALRSLEPAALELSMKALDDVEKERARLDKNWQQNLKRAHYDVDFPDGRRQVSVLMVTWAYSNCPFAIALPTERTEAVLHGMAEAWTFFGCVPREVWWDNPKTVVPFLFKGRQRGLNERYAALASHYHIVRNVPGVRKAVKWNSPLYGVEGQGWFLGVHVFARYVKVAFFRGASLRPLPPGESKQKAVRYLDIHEDDELDEAQVASWIRQAADLPGEVM